MKIYRSGILYGTLFLLLFLLLTYNIVSVCSILHEGFSQEESISIGKTQSFLYGDSPISKIELRGGNNWLHMSEFNLYGPNNQPYTYNIDYTLDINTSPKFYRNIYISSVVYINPDYPPILPPEFGFQFLFDQDPVTFFHSGTNQNVVFTVQMKKPTYISKMVVRNREDCCWDRLSNFTFYLYNEKNEVVQSKKMDDSSLTTYQPDKSVVTNVNAFRQELLQRRKYDNLVAYMFSPYGYMYGSWIGYSQYKLPILEKKTIGNESVYLIEDGPFVKMVTEKGIAKYYTGTIAAFDQTKWAEYISAGDGYKIQLFDKTQRIPAPATPAPTTPAPTTPYVAQIYTTLSPEHYWMNITNQSILYNL